MSEAMKSYSGWIFWIAAGALATASFYQGSGMPDALFALAAWSAITAIIVASDWRL